jgi:hypothetical protein
MGNADVAPAPSLVHPAEGGSATRFCPLSEPMTAMSAMTRDLGDS